MTFDEFITKYNNQKIDFDNSFGAQCVDLYRFYLKEVLGVPQTPGVAGAYQLFATWPYEKFVNTPLGVPQKGDIMIWNQSYGQYGHVGIVTSANLLRFEAFEQNDPIGSPSHLKSYSYKNVLGWLRPPERDDLVTIKTQNKGGELRIVLSAGNPTTWKKLCKDYKVDSTKIDEKI